MRIARRVLGSLVVVLAASPAYAADHQARVNEVLLSVGGDATKQLIEIEDTAAESFPNGGYTLFVYEADGVTQAHFQNLPLQAGTARVTLGTSAALTHFGLATINSPPNVIINLSSDLPANGTACFRRSGVDLHCMSWGLVTIPATAPSNGRLGGPAPTDGMSLQRQTTGNCAGIGAPTANAANMTLACMDPPTMGGVDAGPNTDAGPGSDGGTTMPPGGSDDSCSASGNGTWFGFVATASLFGYARTRRVRRRDEA